jgi:hypothetical protein
LTEGHTSCGICGLIELNAGKLTEAKDTKRIDELEAFLDNVGGGAWPFLVGGVICQFNYDNERDEWEMSVWGLVK